MDVRSRPSYEAWLTGVAAPREGESEGRELAWRAGGCFEERRLLEYGIDIDCGRLLV
jgi:hypothetical protein